MRPRPRLSSVPDPRYRLAAEQVAARRIHAGTERFHQSRRTERPGGRLQRGCRALTNQYCEPGQGDIDAGTGKTSSGRPSAHDWVLRNRSGRTPQSIPRLSGHTHGRALRDPG